MTTLDLLFIGFGLLFIFYAGMIAGWVRGRESGYRRGEREGQHRERRARAEAIRPLWPRRVRPNERMVE